MQSVRETVVEMIYEVCRPDRPDLSDPDRPLLNSGLDSLDFASLLMALEDNFKISIKDEDLGHLGTIDGIVRYVEQCAPRA